MSAEKLISENPFAVDRSLTPESDFAERHKAMRNCRNRLGSCLLLKGVDCRKLAEEMRESSNESLKRDIDNLRKRYVQGEIGDSEKTLELARLKKESDEIRKLAAATIACYEKKQEYIVARLGRHLPTDRPVDSDGRWQTVDECGAGRSITSYYQRPAGSSEGDQEVSLLTVGANLG